MATFVPASGNRLVNLDSFEVIFENDNGTLEGFETARPDRKVEVGVTARELHLAMADFVPVAGYELITVREMYDPDIFPLLGLYVLRGSGAYIAVLTDEGTIIEISHYDKRQYALRLPSGKMVGCYSDCKNLEVWLEDYRDFVQANRQIFGEGA